MATKFLRGTREYDEASKFLTRTAYNGRKPLVADESVHQISSRWLKGDVILRDTDRELIIHNDDVVTRSQRFRIPKGSWLACRPRKDY